MTTAPGWYPDPDDRSKARYWDGEAWTDQTRTLESLGGRAPAAAEGPGPSQPRDREAARPSRAARPPAAAASKRGGRPALPIVVAVLAVLVIGASAALILTQDDDDSASTDAPVAADPATPGESEPAEDEGSGTAPGESSSDSSSSSPSTSIDRMPDDARRCDARVYARRGTTSCAFARNVRRDYERNGSGSFESFSPTTGETYTMSCRGTAPVVCTGGNDAAVYIP